MPAEVVDDPLGVACVFSNGTQATLNLSAGSGRRLAHDMLLGLANLVHPHGSVDAAGTVKHYLFAVRNMATALAARGFHGGAAELTRARLAEYWMGLGHYGHERDTRRALAAFDAVTGALRPDGRDLVDGRLFAAPSPQSPLPPYSETEWARLTGACKAIVTSSYATFTKARAAGERGRDPRTGGWTYDNRRWLISQLGPVTVPQAGEHMAMHPRAAASKLSGIPEAKNELFPGVDVAIAYRALFGTLTGIVPDGIDTLRIEDVDWVGDAAALIDYVKGRAAKESVTVSRRAVRLLEQWLDHSSLLRRFADAEQRRRLWLRHVPWHGHGHIDTGRVHEDTTRAWATRHAADYAGRPAAAAGCAPTTRRRSPTAWQRSSSSRLACTPLLSHIRPSGWPRIATPLNVAGRAYSVAVSAKPPSVQEARHRANNDRRTRAAL